MPLTLPIDVEAHKILRVRTPEGSEVVGVFISSVETQTHGFGAAVGRRSARGRRGRR